LCGIKKGRGNIESKLIPNIFFVAAWKEFNFLFSRILQHFCNNYYMIKNHAKTEITNKISRLIIDVLMKRFCNLERKRQDRYNDAQRKKVFQFTKFMENHAF